VWHLGATAEAVAMDPKAKYPLATDIIITKPTSLNEIVMTSYNQTELQILAPESGAYETSITLQEVPLETGTV
jgi:hypothetical protein